MSGSATRGQDIRKSLAEYFGYYLNRPISPEGRASVLRLHCETNGVFTKTMQSVLGAIRRPRRPVERTGLLGRFSPDQQRQIAQQIGRDGFYVFDNRLPESLCNEIERFARETPTIVQGFSKDRTDRHLFNEAEPPLGKKYSLPEDLLVQSSGMQQLMADQSLTAIAEAYLGTLPSLSDVTLWWSTVHPGTVDEDAGQLYHFDFDTAPRWLMVFVYLTDVGTENGPHVYVRGSHQPGIEPTRELLQRGYTRIPDADVVASFGEDAVQELPGRRGTVMLVDTIGFHKGKSLIKGHRLMAQMVYSFAHFSGERRNRLPIGANVHPSLAKAIEAEPRVYKRFI